VDQPVEAWRLRDVGMVKRIAPTGVVCFVLLAACGGACQTERRGLPDAPSTQLAAQAQKPSGFAEEVRSPLKFQNGFAAAHQAALRQQWPGGAGPSVVPSGINHTAANGNDNDPKGIFRKYLYPSAARPALWHPTESGTSLMGRATHAASRMIITRDDGGKIRLNTPYLLRTLTYVAKDTASTPYWRRSPGEPASDFGVTIGNDAGVNVLHEFAPGIQQLMKSHAPKFVAKMAQAVGHK
jgi:hypothetical protein